MFANIIYGILALYVIIQGYGFFYTLLPWPGYLIWIIVMNFVTLSFFLLDRLIQYLNIPLRVPGGILNLQVFFGGFGGAWIGRTIARQPFKLNQMDPSALILLLSTLLHGFLLYLLIV